MVQIFIVEDVRCKECTSENTKAFIEIHTIHHKSISNSGIYFNTKFEMINVVS